MAEKEAIAGGVFWFFLRVRTEVETKEEEAGEECTGEERAACEEGGVKGAEEGEFGEERAG